MRQKKKFPFRKLKQKEISKQIFMALDETETDEEDDYCDNPSCLKHGCKGDCWK